MKSYLEDGGNPQGVIQLYKSTMDQIARDFGLGMPGMGKEDTTKSPPGRETMDVAGMTVGIRRPGR